MFRSLPPARLRLGLLLALAAGLLASQPASAATTSVTALPAPEAIVNGGGESDPGSTVANGDSDVNATGWEPESGKFTVTGYGVGNHPSAAEATAIGGGANLFSGGHAAASTAEQTIDLTGVAAQVDSGTVGYALGAYLGGYLDQTDNAKLELSFGGAPATTLGPVTPAQRTNKTTLLAREGSGCIPAGARTITVKLTITRGPGSANDGYVDNVRLALGAASPGAATCTPPTLAPTEPPAEPPTGPQPPAAEARHATAVQVICNYLVATGVDTCTATVGDADAKPTIPTGTVSFAASLGTLLGASCTLQAKPSSGNTASCAVQYRRPYGSTKFPEVSAAYSGDATHKASLGATRFLILGGPANFTSQFPNQLSYEVPVDADGTRVTSCGTASSKGSGKGTGLLATKAVRLQLGTALAPALRDMTQQLLLLDDRQTQAVLPALDRAVQQAAEVLGKNEADYAAKVQAGASKQQLAKLRSENEAVKKAMSELNKAMEGICKSSGATKQALTTASAAAAKKRRTAVVLGRVSVNSAKAGSLKVTLKLSRAKVKQLTRKKKTATVYVRTIVRVPHPLFKSGLPRVALQQVKIDRQGKVVAN